MMERYIWINPERLEKTKETKQVAGIDLSVELSPYDSPKAIVGRYDQGSHLFSIEFEYIDEEPAKPCASHEGISIWAGRHSGKLMKICIKIDESPHDDAGIIALEMRVLDALAQQKPKKGGMNRSLAGRLLKDEFKELSKALVTA